MGYRLFALATISLGTVSLGAQAQEGEWVEFDSFEEQYFLSQDAPDAEFNDRTYRFEIAGSSHYEDDTQWQFTVWSDAFVPDIYVREAMSRPGLVGAGQIVARGTYQPMTQDGRTYHVQQMQFLPPESGQYRLVVTSMLDVNEGHSRGEAVTGPFNFRWVAYRWEIPTPPDPVEPADSGLWCEIYGTDASPDTWESGEYGAVYFRDQTQSGFADRQIRFHNFNASWERAQSLVESAQRLYPGTTFVDMMTREEACEYVAGACGDVDYFAQYCSDLGMPIPPTRR